LAGQRRSELLINGSWMLDRGDSVHFIDAGRDLVKNR
jgi:hypothetical protein